MSLSSPRSRSADVEGLKPAPNSSRLGTTGDAAGNSEDRKRGDDEENVGSCHGASRSWLEEGCEGAESESCDMAGEAGIAIEKDSDSGLDSGLFSGELCSESDNGKEGEIFSEVDGVEDSGE